MMTDSGKSPLARRVTYGDSRALADRARALVVKTRAGLGALGPDAGSGEDGVESVSFDMEFVKELNRIHKQSVQHLHDIQENRKNEEMHVITQGITGFLADVAERYPNTAGVINQFTRILEKMMEVRPDDPDEANESEDDTFDRNRRAAEEAERRIREPQIVDEEPAQSQAETARQRSRDIFKKYQGTVTPRRNDWDTNGFD
jgi:hypothetical protein